MQAKFRVPSQMAFFRARRKLTTLVKMYIYKNVHISKLYIFFKKMYMRLYIRLYIKILILYIFLYIIFKKRGPLFDPYGSALVKGRGPQIGQ